MPETLATAEFSAAEAARLAPYFTSLEGPVFALTNLPETVKGALFARYSRSPKSLRRLFLDEFADELQATGGVGHSERADRLYERVFADYGDDSVAQLGSAHLACEDASNILTKVLEWGRLMAYLEQSTRYIPYTEPRAGRWRYAIPDELDDATRVEYQAVLDRAFAAYARWFDPLQAYFAELHPPPGGERSGAWKAAIRARALDAIRGLLPAATQSSVGLHGTGQAFEALLLRMRRHPLAEVRSYGDLMLRELRHVMPAFLTRVDRPDRGDAWAGYLAANRSDMAATAATLDLSPAGTAPEVDLVSWDEDGEVRVAAAALYAVTDLADRDLANVVSAMSVGERTAILQRYTGDRQNRRHRPGRAFEASRYRFDITTDYGAFRDLQRHRMLTIEWQRLSPRHGHAIPEAIEDVGAADDWGRVMHDGAGLFDRVAAQAGADVAQYAVPMAYRLRFYLDMNAREAMHLIELRTAPQGHEAYRRVCQEMYRQIRDRAGHAAIAGAMRFVDMSPVGLNRLAAEQAVEARRLAASR